MHFIATNPTFSVYVDASAGSGKTTLLINRIIKLLLNNTPAHKILCITYTNAAANELLERFNYYKSLYY